MSRKQNNKKITLPVLWLIPLALALTLGGVGIVAIVSHYIGLIELEFKSGISSGAVKIDGRPQ